MGMPEYPGVFEPHATPDQIKTAAEELRDRSFYAPVLLGTFFESTLPNSLVAAKGDARDGYAIGGRIGNWPLGIMRLTWNDYITSGSLKLEVGTAPVRTREQEKRLLLDSGGHKNVLTLESSNRQHGAFSWPNRDGSWTQQIASGLTLSFYANRIQIAPTNPDGDFNYWIFLQFVPTFLRERVIPVARIPRREMMDEAVTDDPEQL